MDETQQTQAAPSEAPSEAPASAPGLERLVDVELRLSVELGTARLPLRDVLQLAKGSVVELDRDRSEPADLYLNGRRIGRGEVTTVDDRLAVRIVELVEAGSGAR